MKNHLVVELPSPKTKLKHNRIILNRNLGLIYNNQLVKLSGVNLGLSQTAIVQRIRMTPPNYSHCRESTLQYLSITWFKETKMTCWQLTTIFIYIYIYILLYILECGYESKPCFVRASLWPASPSKPWNCGGTCLHVRPVQGHPWKKITVVFTGKSTPETIDFPMKIMGLSG